MRKSVQEGDYETTLHIGRDDGQIHLTLAVTNHSDETLRTTSGNATWSKILLVCEHGLSRLESMMSSTVMKTWTIGSGESLVATRVTDRVEAYSEENTPDEMAVEFVTSKDEYRERQDEESVFFAPHVDFSRDEETNMIAKGRAMLEEFPNVTLEFTPVELSEPIDPSEEYELAETSS